MERRGERKEEDGARRVTGSGKGDEPTGKTSGWSRGIREVFARRRGTAAFLRAAKKKIHAQYSAGCGVGRAGRGRVRPMRDSLQTVILSAQGGGRVFSPRR